MSVDLAPIQAKTCIVRATDKHRGRHVSVKPGTTAARHLHFGRIILDAADAPISFSTGERETGFICLRGKARINEHELALYDALYLPRDSDVKISGGCDVAEIAAPVSRRYPAQLVRFADVQKDSALHFHTGGPSAERDVNIVIGKNVDAGRILAGVTLTTRAAAQDWKHRGNNSVLSVSLW
jgi:5-deoxy-glucuronate isomerase